MEKKFEKLHIRHCILHLFHCGLNASEACKTIRTSYNETTVNERMCQRWYKRFNEGDFNVKDMEKHGRPQEVMDGDLEALYMENPSMSNREIAQKMGVSKGTVSKRLNALGIFKQKNKRFQKGVMRSNSSLPRNKQNQQESQEEMYRDLNLSTDQESLMSLEEVDKEQVSVPYLDKRFEKMHIRHCILHLFHFGMNASKACRIIRETYGDAAVNVKLCQRWFRKFSERDFDLNNKPVQGRPQEVMDCDLEELYLQNPSMSTKEIGDQLGVSKTTISRRLNALGFVRSKRKHNE